MSLTITGTVVDESGNGLAGLLVEARGDWLLTSEVIKETTTGAGGGFTLVLPIFAGQPPPPSTCRVRAIDQVGRPVCDDRDVSTVGGDQDLGRMTVRDADRTGLLVTNGKGDARMVSEGNAMKLLIDGQDAFGQVAFDIEHAEKHLVMTQLFFPVPEPNDELKPEKEKPDLVFHFDPSPLEPEEPLPAGPAPQRVDRPRDKRPERLLLDASRRSIPVRILLNKPVVRWPEGVILLIALPPLAAGLTVGTTALVTAVMGIGLTLLPVLIIAALTITVVGVVEGVKAWKGLDRLSHAEELREYLNPYAATIQPPRGEITVRGFEQPAPDNGVLHTKMVIADGQRATVLGSPFEQDYFTDHRHPIDDPRRGDTTGSLFHDVSLGLDGPVVADLYETFRTYWNEDQTPGNQVPTLPLDQVAPPRPAGQDGVIRAQVVRTLSAGRFTFLDGISEKGILEGYLRAFATARRFIYLENQYFTDALIADGLKRALRANTELELIFMLNIRPDLPLYPRRQACLIDSIREAAPNRVGVFTRWSYDPDHPRPWVAPVYLHSKLGLVDDTWASVGSANLDGLSLDRNAFLSTLTIGETTAAELNVNILDGQTGVTGMMPVERLRRRLWAEHLGILGADLEPDPADPQLADAPTKKWLPLWKQVASTCLTHVKEGRATPLPGFVLEYAKDAGGLSTPRKHLAELGIPLDSLVPKIRPVGVTRAFDFFTGRWARPQNREDFVGLTVKDQA
jgi:phosphatidylserine/phosphatidylglycerophosphate/cardiolipin synthase-like enzyme